MNKEKMLEKERLYLSEFALKSGTSILTERKNIENDEDGLRLDFQRDRNRIVHSRAFRRLMHKTQVFNANLGDHYRNRLTHTLEVNQIARSISKNLGLNDELTEAIALGHDLGHTPFGHIGERTLHILMIEKLNNIPGELDKNVPEGFKHNYQSLQIADKLEKRTNDYKGLNLTLAVREGILKHTGSTMRFPKNVKSKKFRHNEKVDVNYSKLDLRRINIGKPSFTLEGQVVAIADEIAQCTHDLEDGIRSGIIDLEDIKDDKLVNKICAEREIKLKDLTQTVDVKNVLIKYMVGALIEDVCKATTQNLEKLKRDNKVPGYTNLLDVYQEQVVCFSTSMKKMHFDFDKLTTNLLIRSRQITQSDLKSEYIIKKIFNAYFDNPQQLPDYILERYYGKGNGKINRLKIAKDVGELQKDSEFVRLVCDHIAGMTDQYASREYKKLYEPDHY